MLGTTCDSDFLVSNVFAFGKICMNFTGWIPLIWKSKMSSNLKLFEHHVGTQKILDYGDFWLLIFRLRFPNMQWDPISGTSLRVRMDYPWLRGNKPWMLGGCTRLRFISLTTCPVQIIVGDETLLRKILRSPGCPRVNTWALLISWTRDKTTGSVHWSFSSVPAPMPLTRNTRVILLNWGDWKNVGKKVEC